MYWLVFWQFTKARAFSLVKKTNPDIWCFGVVGFQCGVACDIP